MSTLISWLAFEEDFQNSGSAINIDGPHMKFYRHHLQHLEVNKHIILLSGNQDHITNRAKILKANLKLEARRFDDRKMLIDDVIVSLNDPFDPAEIYQRLNDYIITNDQEKFTAMINTGTRDMQTVWYLLSARYPKQLDLIKVKHMNYSQNKDAGDLETDVKLESGILPSAFTLRTLKRELPDFQDFQEEARIRAIEVAASPKTTVLILGENGTGKESLAKTIHDNSIRKDKPYEVRNCAGYSDELLRSELFGYVKGAFTGAISDQPGLFKTAEGGTVFLDEIGDISAYMQANLLRVLQNSEIVPVGGNKVQATDVRIIAATNKDLLQMCRDGAFRWDLFYRLAVAEIYTKPVKDMPVQDKKSIIEYFLKAFGQKFKQIGKEEIVLSDETKVLLNSYGFPGNIREIENLIESLYTFDTEVILPKHLPIRIKEGDWEDEELLEVLIHRHAKRIYYKYNQNLTLTQKALGLGSVNTVKKHLRIH